MNVILPLAIEVFNRHFGAHFEILEFFLCMCFTLQLELKVKMVEAKFHEDKLKIQQQHDVAVQKVIIID